MPDFQTLATIVSLLIAATALWRNLKGDTKNDGAQISEVLVKIELMSSDIKEIKADFKAEVKGLKTDLENVKERLTIVEQSTKSAHKRIDGLHGSARKALVESLDAP